MRTFVLNRTEDESGISGTGIVAEGVEFDCGKVVMCWRTHISSVVLYDNIKAVEKIHSHGGKTRIVWRDPCKDGPLPVS